jgi:hypothetical protein
VDFVFFFQVSSRTVLAFLHEISVKDTKYLIGKVPF